MATAKPLSRFSTSTAKPSPNGQLSSRNSDVSSSTTDGGTTTRKIPPIKAPVGLAKGPDLKNCKSKVGSLNNIKHTPAGSGVVIESKKLNWNAKSKVGSLENKEHKPLGGKLKIESKKLEWKASSKVQSLQNVNHKPGGGNVKIFNESYVSEKASTKKSGSPEVSTVTRENDGEIASSNQPSSVSTTKGKDNSLTNNMKGLRLMD